MGRRSNLAAMSNLAAVSVAPRELTQTAIEVARAAGKLLMQELPVGRWRGEVQEKQAGELVTRVDRESEALIRSLVGERYPGHVVLGEEEGVRERTQHAAYRWIVDPLDGTTNFLHGHPFFAVSIGVECVDTAEMVAAVVHAPYLDETYFAARGEGAFMNTWSIPIATSHTDTLADAVVATGFAYDRQRYPNYDNFLRLACETRGIRRCGAAAIDLAFVACGRYDGFWELGLRIWDVAAGALLVHEAGGVVSDFAGGDDWLESGNLVAANGQLGSAIRRQLHVPRHLASPPSESTDEPTDEPAVHGA